MHRRPFVWIVLAVLLAGAFAGCRRVPDEQAVRRAIAAGEAAAQATDAGAFEDLLAEDFTGNAGEIDRRRMVNLLRVARLRGERIRVVMGPVSVEPRGERYVASFTVTLAGGGRLLPADLGLFRVESAWRREGGDWVCYSATWSRPL